IAKFDKTFAKVLRMLATVYLEWDVEKYQDKAISAITLANEEYVHPSGICLELKILLKCGVTWNTMFNFCLNITKNIFLSKFYIYREALAFNFMKTVCMHFEDCPEIGKALLMHIELLLQRGKELLAKQKIENLITGCRNGKQLSSETLDQLHLLLWDKAEKNFEAEKYQESLQWYNYSLNFYSPGQLDKNLGKLQRNRASCYLQLQQMEMANEAIKEAERCDPENIFTQFSIYKIAVLENCEERGAVICYSILCIYNPIEENYHAFFPLKVLSDFYACKRRRPITGLLKEFVLFFFFSTAWNLALECEGYPPLMKDFFVLSYQLSEYCTSDVPGLIGKKTCLLMIAASCLELGRISSDSYEQIFDLANFIRHTVSSKDPTDIIMLLYEFEARAKLNDPKLETVLESVLELPQIEPKALQTIASLAMESPAYFPFLCKKALRIALSLLRKCQDTDIVQCSQCLHSLIQLSLPTGVLEMESQVLEEAWSYYEDAKIIINSTVRKPENPNDEKLLKAISAAGVQIVGLLDYQLLHGCTFRSSKISSQMCTKYCALLQAQ
uniref:Protein ZIP4 homolog n=1 Tax=Erpetoichthys calabaricus TaxID=27687 RepID=A0A8C4SRU4_ERPCA